MKKSKFTEAQITFALRQSETGTRVEEICRQIGVSQATFFNWKKKYGGLGIPELRKLRQLEEENAQLKKLVADLSLDKQMLQDVIKKVVKSPYKKEMANWKVNNYRVSVQRACRCVRLPKSMYYYIHHHRDEGLLKMRINKIAQTRVRYGFEQIFVLLRREGFLDNHKRIYRIYKACGLAYRLERLETQAINKVWSMDFVQDALFNGERFRILTIVDNCSKICHGLLVGKSLKGSDVVGELTRACLVEGCFPERIQCDNGSEFISRDVDMWAY